VKKGEFHHMSEENDAGANPAKNKEIKDWMRSNAMKREQLATDLGVSKGTLDNWFYRGFPDWAVKAISRIMNPTDDLSAGLEVTFTASEFREILEAMEIVGTTSLKTFYEEAIKNHVEKIMADEAAGKTKRGASIAHFPTHLPSSRVAEETGSSDSSSGSPGKKPQRKNGTED
jgi:hypothetical protein